MGTKKRASNLTFPFSKWAKALVLLVMRGWEYGDGGVMQAGRSHLTRIYLFGT